MSEATLSAKNQIVVPKEARTALGVKAGDKLLFVVRGSRVIVLKKPPAPHASLRGLLKRKYPAAYLEKERESWN